MKYNHTKSSQISIKSLSIQPDHFVEDKPVNDLVEMQLLLDGVLLEILEMDVLLEILEMDEKELVH